jgi:hypothetical protein
VFVEGPPNVFLRVDANRTKVLVGVGDDDIIIVVDFLEDSGLELGKVGFAIFWFEVTRNGTFKVPESLGDFKWGLIWHLFAIDPQLLDGFIVL